MWNLHLSNLFHSRDIKFRRNNISCSKWLFMRFFMKNLKQYFKTTQLHLIATMLFPPLKNLKYLCSNSERESAINSLKSMAENISLDPMTTVTSVKMKIISVNVFWILLIRTLIIPHLFLKLRTICTLTLHLLRKIIFWVFGNKINLNFLD